MKVKFHQDGYLEGPTIEMDIPVADTPENRALIRKEVHKMRMRGAYVRERTLIPMLESIGLGGGTIIEYEMVI